MPRGSPKGGNNNVLRNAGADLTPDQLQRLTQQALDTFMSSVHNVVDLHDVDSVHDAIVGYFQTCQRNGLRPGNLGLYAALGMSRQDYNNVVTGKSKSKASPACIDMIKKATRAIGAYREGLALEGKINPITYIFMGKNYDYLDEKSTIEVVAKGPESSLTPEEIAHQIEKDIPVDVDFREDPAT